MIPIDNHPSSISPPAAPGLVRIDVGDSESKTKQVAGQNINPIGSDTSGTTLPPTLVMRIGPVHPLPPLLARPHASGSIQVHNMSDDIARAQRYNNRTIAIALVGAAAIVGAVIYLAVEASQ